MSKVTAPLLSFDARGKIADTQVYSTWRGVKYVRRYTIPANPKSTGQVLTRDIFRGLGLRWKQGATLARAPWDRFAVGQKFLGRNAYMGKNIAVLRGDADMADYIGSPGAKGGLPLTSMTATGAAGGTIDVTFTEPALPAGWTIQACIASAIVDQTPELAVSDIINVAEDVGPTPFLLTLTGLPLVLHQVQGWIRWQKSGAVADVAYGASITQTATPLA